MLADHADLCYAGGGADALTDGRMGTADHVAPEWLGLFGDDLVVSATANTPAER